MTIYERDHFIVDFFIAQVYFLENTWHALMPFSEGAGGRA
jgi:hypothetical protein